MSNPSAFRGPSSPGRAKSFPKLRAICRTVIVTILVAAFLSPAYGQILRQDFLVSQEDTLSKFQQTQPFIFPRDGHGFLVSWTDARNGTPRPFAQYFDSTGSPVGHNIPVASNLDLVYSAPSSFLTVEETYQQTMIDWPTYELSGRIGTTIGTWSEPFSLGVATIPSCGTGWVGIHFDIGPIPEGYLTAFNNAGGLSLGKRDWNGDTLWNWTNVTNFSSPPSIRPAQVAVGSLASGDFAVVWSNAPLIGIDSIAGVVGTFFDANDTPIAENIVLRPDSLNGAFEIAVGSRLHVVPVSDSLYEIFQIRTDALVLYIWKVDRSGSAVGSVTRLDLNPTLAGGIDRWLRNFSFSPPTPAGFKVITTVGTQNYYLDPVLWENTLLTFDRNGDLVDQPEKDTSLAIALGNSFFVTQDSLVIIPSVRDGDIFIDAYNQFDLIWTKKVNDNAPGSNDVPLRVVAAGDSALFAVWKDDRGVFGRMVDGAGTPGDEVRELTTDHVAFLTDGSPVMVWSSDNGDGTSAIKYTILNRDWSVRDSGTLVPAAFNAWLQGTFAVLPDTSLVAIYRTSSSDCRLWRITAGGSISVVSLPSSFGEGSRIFVEDGSSFWVASFDSLKLFSTSLAPIGYAYKNRSYSEYLGNRRFLQVTSSYVYPTTSYYGVIYSPEGDTLVPRFPICLNVSAMSYASIPGGRLLAVYAKGAAVYAMPLGAEGVPRNETILLSPNETSAKGSPVFGFTRERLLAAWSDTRTPGKGFDVYGTMLEVAQLTGVQQVESAVPTSFRLLQNFPNPFNPSTTIRFAIPVRSRVVLEVYNMLGQKVRSIVDETKEAGMYNVHFDAGGLASGVYFYQLRSAGSAIARKMLLLQ